MEEIKEKIEQVVWGVWRYKWIALSLAWLVAIAGWVAVEKMENRYRATARVYVDSNRMLGPLLRGLAVQHDVNERVRLMSKTLLSRPNLERLVRMADMGIDAQTPAENEKLLSGLASAIKLSGSRGNSSLYNVSYTHRDPLVAKRVVHSLLTVFIETTLGDERQDSSTAQAFLDQQISDYQLRLDDAEQRLAEFKRKHAGVMPGEAGGYYQRLEQAENQKRLASLELRELINRRNELRRQISTESPSISSETSGVHPLDVQLAAYQNELNSLRFRYTDKHPRVAQLTEAIADLEEQKLNTEGNSFNVGSAILSANPVYQQLRTMLVDTEARGAELRVRSREYDKQVEELQATIDTIPKVEAELQQLDRDYEIIKEQHNNLLARRESARLSDEVEKNVDDVKFRVIDPPFVPSKPSDPNKSLLTAMVLAVALAAGIAFSFLLSLLRPVFFRRKELAKATGLPVYGSVTQVKSTGRNAGLWIGRLTYGSLFTALMMLFAGLMYFRMASPGDDLVAELEQRNVFANVPASEVLRKVESKVVRFSEKILERIL